MAQRTGTYLLVREGAAPRPTTRPVGTASVLPSAIPDGPDGLRIRRRAVALQPHTLDPGLVVWLDPAHEATDRLYRAAVPLRETLGPVVVVISLDPAVPADVVAANLAGASCAYEQTALVDPGWATGRVAARLGLPVEPTLEAVLAARRLDRTAPIEVLGPARGLDVLCAADAVDLGGGDAEPRLWPLDSVIHDLAARAGLVLVLGPSLADFEPAQWAGVADGVLLVGPATAGLDPAVMRRFDGGPPLGWLATDCATSAAPKA